MAVSNHQGQRKPKAPGQNKLPKPVKVDYYIAAVLGILSLAAYVRTLAPDVLYADSAEFQCLAYTFGTTHSTGYPTYLLLGRLLGFLPINNPAWRISLLSAVCAAITVGGIYLLARFFTRSRAGAILGGLSLAISYTFWSQAVIAEVYTPGMAFLVLIMLFLFQWQTTIERAGNYPSSKKRGIHSMYLLVAAMLAGIGFGIHASVWLIAPPAIALVIWTLLAQRVSSLEWLQALAAGFTGALIGLVIYVTAFLISDQLNPPTSFINTTLEPSRSYWNLQLSNFDSPMKRLKMVVISVQWGDALFPHGNFSFTKEFLDFSNRLYKLEFPSLVLLFGLIGLVVMIFSRPLSGSFYPLAFLFSGYIILNYQVGDKYVFYLSLYIPLVVAIGTGFGFILDLVYSQLIKVPNSRLRLLYLLPVLLFGTMVILPSGRTRWEALRKGVADFVIEDYAYPVYNLKEPRFAAQLYLTDTPDNAVFVLDWRTLYATAYIAQVEKGQKNTLFKEAMPRGNNDQVASTLVTELAGYLGEGRPVYTNNSYPGLAAYFRLLPALGNLYKLTYIK